MNEPTNTIEIKPGMPVFTLDGKELGPVESVNGDSSIHVHTHVVPPAAIQRVDDDGIYLHLAHAAFTAASPITRDTAAPAEG